MKIVIILSLFCSALYAQPNCNYYLIEGDSVTFKACEMSVKSKYYQFDMRQINIWKEAIEMAPDFAYPYYEISAPLVKSGNFIEWKKYMDAAVKYDRAGYLGTRAALRYKFFADYKGTIADLDSLSLMMDDIGYTHNGTYHLDVIKALAYKHVGEKEKAIQQLESYFESDYYSDGLFDYLHLGVMYMEEKQWEKAIDAIEKQIAINDLADVRYYLAYIYKKLGREEDFKNQIQAAFDLFQSNYVMHDAYSILDDQIFYEDLLKLNSE